MGGGGWFVTSVRSVGHGLDPHVFTISSFLSVGCDGGVAVYRKQPILEDFKKVFETQSQV